jgi:spore germination protein KC
VSRRGGLLLGTVLLSLPLAGCWSRLETSELAVVVGYGVDWHDGTYRVTASVLDPRALGTPGQTAGQPDQPAHVLMVGTGSTPGAAFADVDAVSSRRVLWGSADVMVIGQSLAEHGIDQLISAVTHDPEFRPTIRMLVAHGDASAIFAVNRSGLETSTGRQLYLMIQNQHRAQSYEWSPHVFDFVRLQAEQQRAVLVPGLSLAEPDVPEGQAYAVDDSAVLDGSGRLVGWLPRDVVRQAIWIQGHFAHGRFAVPCPAAPGRQGVVFILDGRRSVRPVVRAGRIVRIDLTLSGEGQVTEGCPGTSVQGMSAAASATVAALTQQSLRWAQSRGLDVFGFGETAYRYLPRIWLRAYAGSWPQVFARMPIHLDVAVRITQPGMTR